MLQLVFFSALSGAGEIKHASAEHQGNDYRLSLIMHVDADPEGILNLLTDHDNFHQLSEVMTESGLVQDAPEGRTRRRLVVKTCIVFFCFEVVMVEDVEQPSDNTIVVTMVPGQGDFIYGRAEWQIEPLGPGQSRINYSFHFQPDFWVPPAIGPFLLKRKMIKEARRSILSMESLADGAPGAPAE